MDFKLLLIGLFAFVSFSPLCLASDPCLIYSEIKNIGCTELVIYKTEADGSESYYCTVSPKREHQIFFDHNYNFTFYADDELLKEWVPEDCDDLNLSFDTRGCSIGCEDGTIAFSNKSSCAAKVSIADQPSFFIQPNQTISKTMNKSWKWIVQSTAVDGYQATHSYRVGCKEVVNITGTCPPQCQPMLHITNDGECDGVALLNRVARVIIPAGETQSFNTENGWTWEILTVEENAVMSEFVTNYDCDQNISFDVNCVIPSTEDLPSDDTELVCGTYNEESFESGWGNLWIDGGSDCYRFNNSDYASEGNYSVRLRDNSYQRSSIFTEALDFRHVSKVVIDFSFRVISFEAGESLILEYSTENGANYTPVYTWTSDNGTADFSSQISVDIEEEFGFETRFRIRSHASTNSDMVYIDEVKIQTCEFTSNAISDQNDEFTTQSRSRDNVDNNSLKINVSPTLVENATYLNYSSDSEAIMSYTLSDINGKIVQNQRLDQNRNQEVIDLSSLSGGLYLVNVYSEGQIMKTQKIIKQ